MIRHLDDMRHYISLSEASVTPIMEESVQDEFLEEIVESETPNPILEDINNILFKLQSYRLQEGSEDYADGVEEGLTLAANMLMRLIERHEKPQR